MTIRRDLTATGYMATGSTNRVEELAFCVGFGLLSSLTGRS